MKKKLLIFLLLLSSGLLTLSGCAGKANGSTDTSGYTTTGTVESKEISVRAKIPGYIDKTYVKEGQTVAAGDVLFQTEQDDLQVKQTQARAAADAAYAVYQKALNGARPQEIEAARTVRDKAQANVDMLQDEYNKTEVMYETGAVSDTDMNKLTTQLKAAKLDLAAAKAQYNLACQGARAEDIAAAKAQYEAALGVLDEVNLNLEATTVKAPASGTVTMISSEEGELIGSGTPIVTLTDYTNSWVLANVPETYLGQIKLGDTVNLTSKAFPGETFGGQIININKNPDFATKKSTNELNDYDTVSYEIKIALPKDTKLFPGMSVEATFAAPENKDIANVNAKAGL